MGAIRPEPEYEMTQVGGWDSGTGLLNRELSWLAFDARVLALAADARQPLLERVKFCAIFSSNLDEFFQVRVAGLADQVAAGDDAVSPDGRSASLQLREIRSVVERLVQQQTRLLHDDLLPALAAEGIRVARWAELTDAQRVEQAAFFRTRIFPVLTPLAVDPGHPFPYISDLSLNLAVMVRDPVSGRTLFARVKVPSPLPRFLPVGDSGDWLALEELIAAQLPALFPGLEVLEHHVFRVTRNADLSLREGEAEDLLAAVETELRRRRFGRAVRLEVATTTSRAVRELLARELDLDPDEIYDISGLVDSTGLLSLLAARRPELSDAPWQGITEPAFAPVDEEPLDLFATLRAGDVLVHHPYTSFTTSVVAFIRAAADDPDVLAIKITLYRTSGDSPIIEALVDAAEKGKQVAVLVELKARFDERSNIESARRLEQSGVHVAYGLVGYKIHTKVCLVIREEADGIRRYCHIGTGNYNPRTARLYEDIGLFTADADIGEDCTHLFNSLTGYGRSVTYRRLLVAPETLRGELLARIENEIAHRGRITMKMNSLVDPEFIDLLTRASQAGVEIDLLVRGICCLRPGVPGLTETIRVRSIVGRFLEHSRVYVFGNGLGAGRPEHLIGSADLMPRNLDRRVEVLAPVDEPALVARIDDMLRAGFLDDTLAWSLDADGVWTRATGGTHDSQLELQRLALGRAADARRGEPR
jgi:polyphosphate kinase